MSDVTVRDDADDLDCVHCNDNSDDDSDDEDFSDSDDDDSQNGIESEARMLLLDGEADVNWTDKVGLILSYLQIQNSNIHCVFYY